VVPSTTASCRPADCSVHTPDRNSTEAVAAIAAVRHAPCRCSCWCTDVERAQRSGARAPQGQTGRPAIGDKSDEHPRCWLTVPPPPVKGQAVPWPRLHAHGCTHGSMLGSRGLHLLAHTHGTTHRPAGTHTAPPEQLCKRGVHQAERMCRLGRRASERASERERDGHVK